jgi:hypothetical protein
MIHSLCLPYNEKPTIELNSENVFTIGDAFIEICNLLIFWIADLGDPIRKAYEGSVTLFFGVPLSYYPAVLFL